MKNKTMGCSIHSFIWIVMLLATGLAFLLLTEGMGISILLASIICGIFATLFVIFLYKKLKRF